MHGEHDPTQDRRPGAARRGRRPYGEPVEPSRGPARGTADDPFAYGSWISLDVRAARPPAPPAAPPQWSWPELPRDRLLRSALVLGFLAAAGVGVWTSGWTPLSGQAGPHRAAPIAPAATGRPATPPVTPVTPSAARPVRDRPPKASAPAERPRPRPAAGSREGAPGRARTRHEPPPAAAGPKATGTERPRGAETATRRRRPPETAGASRAGTPSRRPEKPPASSGGSGGREHRTAPAPRTGTGPTGSPAAPAGQGTGSPAGTGSPLTVDERLGAAYACRHLRPDDWRYAYCVTAWNDYKKRIGLP